MGGISRCGLTMAGLSIGFKILVDAVHVSPLACTDWCIKTSAHFCKGAGHKRGGVSLKKKKNSGRSVDGGVSQAIIGRY